MAEYALLTAGTVLAPMRLFADRVISSVAIDEVVLAAAGAWLAWRVLNRLVGPRTR